MHLLQQAHLQMFRENDDVSSGTSNHVYLQN